MTVQNESYSTPTLVWQHIEIYRTLSWRFKSAPAFATSTTASVFPLLEALIRADSPFYVHEENVRPQIHTQYQHTLFCRFRSAPAFTISTTASVPHCPEAMIRAVSPSYVVTQTIYLYTWYILDNVVSYTMSVVGIDRHTLSCMWMSAPLFTSITTLLLLPCLAATITADCPFYVRTMSCEATDPYIYNTNIQYFAGSHWLLPSVELLLPQSHIALKLRSEQSLYPVWWQIITLYIHKSRVALSWDTSINAWVWGYISLIT